LQWNEQRREEKVFLLEKYELHASSWIQWDKNRDYSSCRALLGSLLLG